MQKFVMGSVVLMLLASCGSASDRDNSGQVVCEEQSDWARSGKVGGGDITITCPGYDRPAN
jgi:hypothetical protein